MHFFGEAAMDKRQSKAFINGLMVMLVSKLYEPLHVTNFSAALLAGMVIGLVNYLVTTILEDK